MGGLCTTNVQVLPDPKEVLKETQIPEWVSAGGQKLFQQAAGLAQSDFPLFEGARLPTYEDIKDPGGVSKLTEQEQKGLGLLEEEGDIYEPYLQRAGEVATDIGAQRIDPSEFGAVELEKYAPIYEQAVQPALEDVSETFARRRRELNAAAAKAGAYGGGRQGAESAILTGEEARERGRILSESGRGGLEFAAGQFERDRGAGERAFDLNQASRKIELGAAQSLGPLAQGLMQQEAQGLIGAGEATRKLDEEALRLAYTDYVEQREFPFTQTNFALGALKGLPFETREFSMQRGGQFIPTPSVYGQTMGGLGALASAYKLLNT
jgi:hypothetical protein